jgi:hypothetical protein
MTVTNTDIELFFDLVEDAGVPCDFDKGNEKQCTEGAVWHLSLTCCTIPVLFCDKHKNRAVDAGPNVRFFHDDRLGGCGSHDCRVKSVEKL